MGTTASSPHSRVDCVNVTQLSLLQCGRLLVPWGWVVPLEAHLGVVVFSALSTHRFSFCCSASS